MTRLVLDLDRKDVSVEAFTEAFKAQVRLVELVMADMGIPTHEVRWVVANLDYGSALAEAEPHATGENVYMSEVDRAIAMSGRGVRELSTTATRPKHFGDEALKTSRRLIQLVTESDHGKSRLRFGDEEVKPSTSLITHVETLVRGNLPSIGSIEGKLVQVSGQDGSYSIHVLDRLRGRKVKAHIPEDVLPRALKAFESRVIVRGIIWSRSDGSAVRIDVKTFETIPSDDELPRASDVRGILRGYERADGE